jgi:hypothetical protein
VGLCIVLVKVARVPEYWIPLNGVRLHSGIGYASPVDYEARTT